MVANRNRNNEPEPVPPGFSLIPSCQDILVIHHKRTGMGCMNVFLVIWLTGWTFFCVWILHEFLSGGRMEDGDPIPLWFVLVFWGFEALGACLVAYGLFCKKSFLLTPDYLTMETEVLGFRWRKAIPKNSIKRFSQVMDGGVGEDSFPSWGLKVMCKKRVTLIHRQPYDVSHWLGRILSQWAAVEFDERKRPSDE